MSAPLLEVLRAACPGGDQVDLLADYVADHPRDREALSALLDAAVTTAEAVPAREMEALA